MSTNRSSLVADKTEIPEGNSANAAFTNVDIDGMAG
jgi:hypothetical protein